MKYEILRSIGLHDFVVPDGASRFDINGQLLRRLIRSITQRSTPIGNPSDVFGGFWK